MNGRDEHGPASTRVPQVWTEPNAPKTAQMCELIREKLTNLNFT